MYTAVAIPETGQPRLEITARDQEELILEYGTISIVAVEAYWNLKAHTVISLGDMRTPWNCKGLIQVFDEPGGQRRLLWPAPTWEGVVR